MILYRKKIPSAFLYLTLILVSAVFFGSSPVFADTSEETIKQSLISACNADIARNNGNANLAAAYHSYIWANINGSSSAYSHANMVYELAPGESIAGKVINIDIRSIVYSCGRFWNLTSGKNYTKQTFPAGTPVLQTEYGAQYTGMNEGDYVGSTSLALIDADRFASETNAWKFGNYPTSQNTFSTVTSPMQVTVPLDSGYINIPQDPGSQTSTELVLCTATTEPEGLTGEEEWGTANECVSFILVVSRLHNPSQWSVNGNSSIRVGSGSYSQNFPTIAIGGQYEYRHNLNVTMNGYHTSGDAADVNWIIEQVETSNPADMSKTPAQIFSLPSVTTILSGSDNGITESVTRQHFMPEGSSSYIATGAGPDGYDTKITCQRIVYTAGRGLAMQPSSPVCVKIVSNWQVDVSSKINTPHTNGEYILSKSSGTTNGVAVVNPGETIQFKHSFVSTQDTNEKPEITYRVERSVNGADFVTDGDISTISSVMFHSGEFHSVVKSYNSSNYAAGSSVCERIRYNPGIWSDNNSSSYTTSTPSCFRINNPNWSSSTSSTVWDNYSGLHITTSADDGLLKAQKLAIGDEYRFTHNAVATFRNYMVSSKYKELASALKFNMPSNLSWTVQEVTGPSNMSTLSGAAWQDTTLKGSIPVNNDPGTQTSALDSIGVFPGSGGDVGVKVYTADSSDKTVCQRLKLSPSTRISGNSTNAVFTTDVTYSKPVCVKMVTDTRWSFSSSSTKIKTPYTNGAFVASTSSNVNGILVVNPGDRVDIEHVLNSTDGSATPFSWQVEKAVNGGSFIKDGETHTSYVAQGVSLNSVTPQLNGGHVPGSSVCYRVKYWPKDWEDAVASGSVSTPACFRVNNPSWNETGTTAVRDEISGNTWYSTDVRTNAKSIPVGKTYSFKHNITARIVNYIVSSIRGSNSAAVKLSLPTAMSWGIEETWAYSSQYPDWGNSSRTTTVSGASYSGTIDLNSVFHSELSPTSVNNNGTTVNKSIIGDVISPTYTAQTPDRLICQRVYFEPFERVAGTNTNATHTSSGRAYSTPSCILITADSEWQISSKSETRTPRTSGFISTPTSLSASMPVVNPGEQVSFRHTLTPSDSTATSTLTWKLQRSTNGGSSYTDLSGNSGNSAIIDKNNPFQRTSLFSAGYANQTICERIAYYPPNWNNAGSVSFIVSQPTCVRVNNPNWSSTGVTQVREASGNWTGSANTPITLAVGDTYIFKHDISAIFNNYLVASQYSTSSPSLTFPAPSNISWRVEEVYVSNPYANTASIDWSGASVVGGGTGNQNISLNTASQTSNNTSSQSVTIPSVQLQGNATSTGMVCQRIYYEPAGRASGTTSDAISTIMHNYSTPVCIRVTSEGRWDTVGSSTSKTTYVPEYTTSTIKVINPGDDFSFRHIVRSNSISDFTQAVMLDYQVLSTNSSSANGTEPSAGNIFASGSSLVWDSNPIVLEYPFDSTDSSVIGRTICQRIQWSPSRWDAPITQGTSGTVCVRVNNPSWTTTRSSEVWANDQYSTGTVNVSSNSAYHFRHWANLAATNFTVAPSSVFISVPSTYQTSKITWEVQEARSMGAISWTSPTIIESGETRMTSSGAIKAQTPHGPTSTAGVVGQTICQRLRVMPSARTAAGAETGPSYSTPACIKVTSDSKWQVSSKSESSTPYTSGFVTTPTGLGTNTPVVNPGESVSFRHTLSASESTQTSSLTWQIQRSVDGGSNYTAITNQGSGTPILRDASGNVLQQTSTFNASNHVGKTVCERIAYYPSIWSAATSTTYTYSSPTCVKINNPYWSSTGSTQVRDAYTANFVETDVQNAINIATGDRYYFKHNLDTAMSNYIESVKYKVSAQPLLFDLPTVNWQIRQAIVSSTSTSVDWNSGIVTTVDSGNKNLNDFIPNNPTSLTGQTTPGNLVSRTDTTGTVATNEDLGTMICQRLYINPSARASNINNNSSYTAGGAYIGKPSCVKVIARDRFEINASTTTNTSLNGTYSATSPKIINPGDNFSFRHTLSALNTTSMHSIDYRVLQSNSQGISSPPTANTPVETGTKSIFATDTEANRSIVHSLSSDSYPNTTICQRIGYSPKSWSIPQERFSNNTCVYVNPITKWATSASSTVKINSGSEQSGTAIASAANNDRYTFRHYVAIPDNTVFQDQYVTPGIRWSVEQSYDGGSSWAPLVASGDPGDIQGGTIEGEKTMSAPGVVVNVSLAKSTSSGSGTIICQRISYTPSGEGKVVSANKTTTPVCVEIVRARWEISAKSEVMTQNQNEGRYTTSQVDVEQEGQYTFRHTLNINTSSAIVDYKTYTTINGVLQPSYTSGTSNVSSAGGASIIDTKRAIPEDAGKTICQYIKYWPTAYNQPASESNAKTTTPVCAKVQVLRWSLQPYVEIWKGEKADRVSMHVSGVSNVDIYSNEKVTIRRALIVKNANMGQSKTSVDLSNVADPSSPMIAWPTSSVPRTDLSGDNGTLIYESYVTYVAQPDDALSNRRLCWSMSYQPSSYSSTSRSQADSVCAKVLVRGGQGQTGATQEWILKGDSKVKSPTSNVYGYTNVKVKLDEDFSFKHSIRVTGAKLLTNIRWSITEEWQKNNDEWGSQKGQTVSRIVQGGYYGSEGFAKDSYLVPETNIYSPQVTPNDKGYKVGDIVCQYVHYDKKSYSEDEPGQSAKVCMEVLPPEWKIEPLSQVRRNDGSYKKTVYLRPGDEYTFNHALTVRGSYTHKDVRWRINQERLRYDEASAVSFLPAESGRGSALKNEDVINNINNGYIRESSTIIRQTTMHPDRFVSDDDTGGYIQQSISFDPSETHDEDGEFESTPWAKAHIPFNYDITPYVSIADTLSDSSRSMFEPGSNVGVGGNIRIDSIESQLVLDSSGQPENYSTRTKPTTRILTVFTSRGLVNFNMTSGRDYFENTDGSVCSSNNYNRSGVEHCAIARTYNPNIDSGSQRYFNPNSINPVFDYNYSIPTNAAIGSKICFALSSYPSESGENVWRHSRPVCLTIGKRPKTQITGAGLYANKIMTNQTIRENVLFGSWVEYEAVAPDSITRFASGSAYQTKTYGIGVPYIPNNASVYSKLTLTNDNPARLGYYGINASNFGNMIDNITIKSAGTQAMNTGEITITDDHTDSKKKTIITSNVSTILRSIEDKIELNKSTYLMLKVDGDIRITKNIIYKDDLEIGDPRDLPQMIIIADNINIDSNVTRIDSWLIARDTINTCRRDIPAGRNIHSISNLDINVCDKSLTVNGPVYANNIKLFRTAGSFEAGQKGYAEWFNLRPDVYMWGYHQSEQNGAPVTTFTQELAPRL
jgi:hypothetical protein